MEILDSYLRTSRPDFYSKLNEPLTDNEIRDLEVRFNIMLPEDLKALYQWKNGQKGQLMEFCHVDNDRNIIAPNLQTFIEAINQFYETKEASDFDEYFEVENIKDFSKKFYVE